MAGSKYEAKNQYQHYVPSVKKIPEWYKLFNFVLVTSMEQLNQIFIDSNWRPGESFIAFDTETTGLNAEELDIVGYSFCIDGQTTYYVPVNHFEYEHNLGEPACEYIYKRMCEARQVFMYNARFDERVFEYMGYKDNKDALDKVRWNFVKYDMSKINLYDVMNAVFVSDTNDKMPSLKDSSLRFLGFEQMHFDEVIEEAGNFYYLNPSENPDVVYYAGADALCTYLLVPATMKYYKEAGMAGQLDNLVIYPLMHYEAEKIYLDGPRLRRMTDECAKEVDRLERDVYNALGYQINLNSPQQVANALERLGIDTGERTATGNMATGMKVLESLPQELRDRFPALDSFLRYKEVNKLYTTYFKTYLKEYEEKGYVRISYKIHQVPTGRLASGKDGKNTFFSPVNGQALPKPHVCMYDVYDFGPQYRNYFSKKDNVIMGYAFVPATYDANKNHVVPTDPRYIGWAEGMNQELNIRSCLTGKISADAPDDEWLYCLDPNSSFVETEEMGYVPLFEVEKRMNLGNEVHVKTPNGYKRVLNYMHTGKKKVCRVALKDGSEVLCSRKHKFMTQDGWKTVEELVATDSIIVDENFLHLDDPWKPIPGYGDLYKVNVYTEEIYRVHNGKSGKPWHKVPIITDDRGYKKVLLFDGKKQRTCRLGRVILSAFFGEVDPFGYKFVDHVDANPGNNDIRNLKPVTPKQNNWKTNIYTKYQKGQLNSRAKLSDEDTRRVIEEFNRGVSEGNRRNDLYKELAKKYNVSYSLIRWVINYREEPNIVMFNENSNVLGVHFTSVEYDMVDIEVEEVHCYYVNKLLTHNCACDYSAQELRLVANMSHEPVWENAFAEGRDVHRSTAEAVWGPENYNKDMRKRAKGVNFAVVYGAQAASFNDPFYGIHSLAEAEEFYDNYKSKLPTLFQWIARKQRQGRKNGSVHTYFGRPRRVKGYFDMGAAGFANRTIVNTQIQGTAADILKLVMIRLWKNLLNHPDYKDDVRFLITIHDEIGYGVRASRINEIMGKIEDNQTLILDEWRVPIITEASCGWSVGGLFAWERIYDSEDKSTWHYVPKLD